MSQSQETQKVASASKRFFVRGVAERLQRGGQTRFGSIQLMKVACDHVALHAPLHELLAHQGEGKFAYVAPTDEQTAKVARALMEADKLFLEQGYKTASQNEVVVFGENLTALGQDVLGPVKLAMEYGAAVMSGQPHQQNSLVNDVTNEGRMEAMRRPPGYAVVPPGGAVFNTPRAARVGVEIPHPFAESGVQGTTNAVVDSSFERNAKIALDQALQKLSMPGYGSSLGGTVDSSNPALQNTINEDVTAEGKMEAARRPQEYAVEGIGGAVAQNPQSVHVGKEMPHPLAESGVQGTGNAATQASNAKNAAFADKLMGILPAKLSPEEKIAVVQNTLQLDLSVRKAYLDEVFRRHA